MNFSKRLVKKRALSKRQFYFAALFFPVETDLFKSTIMSEKRSVKCSLLNPIVLSLKKSLITELLKRFLKVTEAAIKMCSEKTENRKLLKA